MNASVYAEYIEHPSIPNGRAYVSLTGKRMELTAEGWSRSFPTRRACVKWCAENIPDATVWAFDNGITVCAGNCAGIAKRAGIEPTPTPLFA